jgi:hypothetical protein
MSAKGSALDGLKAQMKTVKSPNERMFARGGEFPECKGFYPDCPEKPSLLDNKCRNCPKIDGIKKLKLEWVDCENCGEDGVPVDVESKKDIVEDTKCHVCGKMNSKEAILKQR